METVLDWLADSFPEVSPKEFYRWIFPAGELEKKGEHIDNPRTGKYTGIFVAITGDRKTDGNRKIKRYTITDELDAIDTAIQSDDFCLCSPISYAGKQRTAENARYVYAIAIDVDKIRMRPDRRTGEPEGLRDLYHQMFHDTKYGRYLPIPTFMVGSGTGLHLYYVLETPLPLYHDIAQELQRLKRELTRKVWNSYVVNIDNDKEIQQEGIYQGFRMPGTITKNGGRARAFLTGERVTLEYLNGFVEDTHKAKKAAGYKRGGKMRLSEARAKYPEWYEKRIERGEKRGQWAVNRSLYDWWKREISTKAKVGHRYYCLMTLAMYARKCSIYDAKHNPNPVTREELERDCFELLEPMEKLTDKEDNHFSTDDVLAALESFDDKWTTYPRASIEYRSGIIIPENKRNGRKQSEHIKLMNYIRDELNGNKTWNRDGNGRKSQFETVKKWRQDNPDGTKAACIRETGLSRATVYRHWDINGTQARKTAEKWRKQAEDIRKDGKGGELSPESTMALGMDTGAAMLEVFARLEAMEDTPEKQRIMREWTENAARMTELIKEAEQKGQRAEAGTEAAGGNPPPGQTEKKEQEEKDNVRETDGN